VTVVHLAWEVGSMEEVRLEAATVEVATLEGRGAVVQTVASMVVKVVEEGVLRAVAQKAAAWAEVVDLAVSRAESMAVEARAVEARAVEAKVVAVKAVARVAVMGEATAVDPEKVTAEGVMEEAGWVAVVKEVAAMEVAMGEAAKAAVARVQRTL